MSNKKDNPEYCRLCQGTDLKLVFSTIEFDIIECSNCKIAFTYPIPNLPDYVNMDFHSGENKESADKLIFIENLHPDWQRLIRLQTKMIIRRNDWDIKILEIGCGEGILLDELRKAGFQNIEGIEPSKTAFQRAQRKGLKISNGYFDNTRIERCYDLVIMSHVFEHIEDPKSFVEKVKSVLKPGGSIMLTQTNFKALMPRYLKENWYAWVPDQHYWHFTPSGLEKMFRQHGFMSFQVKYCTLVHPRTKLNWLARRIPFLLDQFVFIAKME